MLSVSVNNHKNLHTFIFGLLSIYLFILLPVSFIHKFLAAAVSLGVALNIQKLNLSFKHWYEPLLAFLVNAYLTVAIFGYDLFMSHSLYSECLLNVLTFGIGFIWTSYLLAAILNVMQWVIDSKRHFAHMSSDGYWKKWGILFTIMFAMFALWQIAFNPIVLSSDSWGYMDGWLNDRYGSWHSPLFALCINIVCSLSPVKPEVIMIAVWQNIAFSALLTTILMYFHQRWIRYRFIVPFAFALPLIPSFGLHTIVVWCDLATGMTMLWLTYALVRVIDEIILHKTASHKQQISLCCQLGLSLTLAYFIRSNSFFVYLIIIPILAVFFAIKKNKQLIITVASSIVLVLLIQFPVYSLLGVTQEGANDIFKYYAGLHDIQATYYSGGQLSPQTEANLKKYITNLDDAQAREGFQPDWFMVSIYKKDFRELSELKTSDFITMYVDTLIHNPVQMIRSIMWRMRAYLIIDTKNEIGCVNYTDIYAPSSTGDGVTASEIGVYRNPNFLTTIMTKYIIKMNMQIPATFVWRYGVWVAFIVVSMLALILQKRFVWLLTYLPVMLYLLTLVLSMPWHDYRYGLSVVFIGMFLPIASLFLADGSKPVKKGGTKKNPAAL